MTLCLTPDPGGREIRAWSGQEIKRWLPGASVCSLTKELWVSTPGDEGAGTAYRKVQVAPKPEAMFRVNCTAPFRFAF